MKGILQAQYVKILNASISAMQDFAQLRKQLNAVFDELYLILTTYTAQNISQMTLSQLDQYGKHLREQELQLSIRGDLGAEFEKILNQIAKGLEQLKQTMKPRKSILINTSSFCQPDQNTAKVLNVNTAKSLKQRIRTQSHAFIEVSSCRIVPPTLAPTVDRYSAYSIKNFAETLLSILPKQTEQGQIQTQLQTAASREQGTFRNNQTLTKDFYIQLQRTKQLMRNKSITMAHSRIDSSQRPDSKNEPIGNNQVSSRKKQLENRIKNVISPQLRQSQQLNDQNGFAWPFNYFSQHQNIHSTNFFRQPEQKQE